MFNNKKVIIFDMDGTLIDSVGIWNTIDELLIKRLSGNNQIEILDIQKDRDKVLANCKTNDIYTEYCDYLRKKYNSSFSTKEIVNLRRNISDYYIDNVIDYKKNADVLLNMLKEQGFFLALATTTTNIQLDSYKTRNKNIINKANLEEIFDVILAKEDVKRTKPHPEIYKIIMKKLNVLPSECLVIEDSLIGVKAALNAKIDVAVIYDKYADIDRLQINELSQYQFDNFGQIIELLRNEYFQNKIIIK